jgi:magnesium chelatase family protein
LSVREIEGADGGDDSASVRERVTRAQQRRQAREGERARASAKARSPLLELAGELEPSALRLLHRSMGQLELSLRAYAKLLKVSRTIADLDASERVRVPHVAEAIQYRLFDREQSRPAPGLPRRADGDPELDPATSR